MRGEFPTGYLTVARVAAVAGVDTRTVQRWVSSGLTPATVHRPGRGGWYRFNFADTLRVIVVARLRDSGLPMQQLRKAVQILADEWKQADPLKSGGLVMLDGRLHYAESPQRLWDILSRQRVARELWVLDVGRMAEELAEKAPELKMAA